MMPASEFPLPHAGEGHDCMYAGGRATQGAVAEGEGISARQTSHFVACPSSWPSPLEGEKESNGTAMIEYARDRDRFSWTGT